MSRTDAIAKDFMLWQFGHDDRHPNPEDYLERSPDVDGVPVSSVELERAVLTLDALGLIKGMKAMGRRMPLRARLTDDGVVCATRYGGEVKAWDSARGSSSAPHSTRVGAGRDAQVGDHGSTTRSLSVEQPRVDFDTLLTASRNLEGVLPALPESARIEAAEAIEHVRAADRSSDEPEARRWAERLLRIVVPLAQNASLLNYVVTDLTRSVH